MLTVTNGTAAVPQERLFELIWQETSVLRREAHNGRCPTPAAPYGERDPHGARLSDACLVAACMEIVHDVYIKITPKLDERLRSLRDSGELGDPVRYAHRTITSEVADMYRHRRVERGSPAKPSRSDGVPGRVIAALAERAEDGAASAWYEQLFRMMRGYVCKAGAPGRGWPLDVWTTDKERADGRLRAVGGESARREIRTDITWVLGVATEVAGERWVHQNITGPLQTSSAQLSLDAIDAAHGQHPTVDAPDEEVLAGLARSEYARQRRLGAGPAEATRAALNAVYGIAPRDVSQDVVRRVADLLDLEGTV